MWGLGRLNRVARWDHKEVWKIMDEIMNKYMTKHLQEKPSSTMEICGEKKLSGLERILFNMMEWWLKM